MLRAIGLKFLAWSGVLLCVAPLCAQSPLYTPGQWEATAPPTAGSAVGRIDAPRAGQPIADGSIQPLRSTTQCTFDAYEQFDESVSRGKHVSWRQHHCEHRDHSSGGCRGSDEVCDFECANCYSRFDIEKRILYSYSHGSPKGDPTKSAYGVGHAAQVGAELLPYVLTDSENYYTRWGATFMFNYVNYEGNRQVTLRSELSGNLLTVDDAMTYGLVIGPTLRTDFEIFGIRFSPHATVGLALDWTNVHEILPQGTVTRNIDRFKFTSFDHGAYVRLMLDFGITETIQIGVGGDWKAVKTDAMLDNEFRRHLGVLIGISHEF